MAARRLCNHHLWKWRKGFSHEQDYMNPLTITTMKIDPRITHLNVNCVCRAFVVPKQFSPKFLKLAVNWHSLSRCDWEGTRHCCCRQATTRTGRVLIFFLTLKTNVLTSKANVLTLNTSMVNLKTTFLLPTSFHLFSQFPAHRGTASLSPVWWTPRTRCGPKTTNNEQIKIKTINN